MLGKIKNEAGAVLSTIEHNNEHKKGVILIFFQKPPAGEGFYASHHESARLTIARGNGPC